ncbi:uncharacterized protein LOC109540501 isoform X2 [Dendroctonus ponderosae]|uniref:uncharacterized protein LOC109540501 isoform X2 n=1 Tax=Dendroctonus ponderosae TaxID=77166 RepID=UPI002035843C|nr:uncharacterized protein LOC109540501 isoform X2 [Dendroctonus ponderosae]
MSDNEIIPKNQRLFLITQGCFHILMGIFVASTVWLMAYNRDWGSMHTWHVFLSTIGFALLMAEAVAMQNPGNGFFLGYGKIARGFLHGVLMLLATTAVLAGVSIKIQDKALNNRSHFTTTHGIVATQHSKDNRFLGNYWNNEPIALHKTYKVHLCIHR